jgi:hypothetical protein
MLFLYFLCVVLWKAVDFSFAIFMWEARLFFVTCRLWYACIFLFCMLFVRAVSGKVCM